VTERTSKAAITTLTLGSVALGSWVLAVCSLNIFRRHQVITHPTQARLVPSS